eukprot:1563682-Rhodomonas_salina.1
MTHDESSSLLMPCHPQPFARWPASNVAILSAGSSGDDGRSSRKGGNHRPVSYTHLRAHETEADL